MTTIINGRLLGKGDNAKIMAGNATFSFNGYNLDNGITTRVISCDSDDLGKVDFETFNYALQDGGGVLGRYFRTHTINIGISISEETQEKLQALMDEIKYQCSVVQAPLRIKCGNVIREWIATCTSIKFNRASYNVNRLGGVQLTFQATNPHSHSLESSSLNITSQTGLYKYSIGYLGRATSYFTLNIAIESAGTYEIYCKVNGFKLSIPSATYSVGDIIKIDGTTKKATVNGTEVEYVGSFRPLNYGDNPIEIYYGGTYTATLSYYENYL